MYLPSVLLNLTAVEGTRGDSCGEIEIVVVVVFDEGLLLGLVSYRVVIDGVSIILICDSHIWPVVDLLALTILYS